MTTYTYSFMESSVGKGLGRLVCGAAKRLCRCGAKDRGFESRERR